MSQLPIIVEKSVNLQEKTAWQMGDVFPDEGYDGLSKVTLTSTNPTFYPLYVDNTNGLDPNHYAGFDRYYTVDHSASSTVYSFIPQEFLIANTRKYNYACFKVVATNEDGVYTAVTDYKFTKFKIEEGMDELVLSELDNYNLAGMWIIFVLI